MFHGNNIDVTSGKTGSEIFFKINYKSSVSHLL